MSSFFLHDNARTLIVALMGYSIIKRRRKYKNRLRWKKSWLGDDQFSHMPLLRHLKSDEPDDFKAYLRLDEMTFEKLLAMVKERLTKKDTVMRQAISPEQRLIVTLRFLASGRYYNCLTFSAGIAAQTLSYLIPETCSVIYEVLSQEYLKFPKTKDEWKEIASKFKDRWQFINCGGALDGKHIRIRRPHHSSAKYFNYKGFYSIVLMALVDADYKFIWLDVGKQGRMSDGGVFLWTELYSMMEKNMLNFPTAEENDMNLDFVLVADEAFALHKHLMKPYPQRLLTHETRIFNYRLSRARNVVENAFGIMTSRFRVFHTCLSMNVAAARKIVAAACVLHNFLMTECANYRSQGSSNWETAENHWREESAVLPNLKELRKNNTSIGKINQERYCKFFNGDGKITWQEEMLQKGKR